MKRPAMFLDRDGTINEQMGYINHSSRFHLLPGTGEAVRLLNQKGYLALVVSNQSGVARGYFPRELVDQVHQKMVRLLDEQGAFLDGIFYCPHYPSGKVQEYAHPCICRKPQTGLIQQAQARFEIDMARSYVIGDRISDLQMAQNCGLKSILVLTGYGLGDMEYVIPHSRVQPFHVAPDLLHAVRWVLEQENRFEGSS